MAQLVRNPPAMKETSVRSLGWEDPLEKGKATHSSVLAWRIPRTVYSRGCKELDAAERLSLHFWSLKVMFKKHLVFLGLELMICLCSPL